MSKWTLFSNHGHVLLFLSQDPEARLRDVAGKVGITERAVQKIVRDLQDAGMLSVTKHGRRNRYRIHTRKSLRHQLESHCTVGQLVQLIDRPAPEIAAEPELEPKQKPVQPPDPVAAAPKVAEEKDPVPEPAVEAPQHGEAEEAEPAAPFPESVPGAERREARPEEPAEDAGEQGSLF